MRYFLVAAAVMLSASPAWATAVAVPEMDAGFGLTSLAIVAGAVAIVREKFFRK